MSSPQKHTLTIIIPFLNEEIGIKDLVCQLNTFFIQEKSYIPHITFVDDGSNDRSLELLKSQTHHYSHTIIKLSKNYGSHAALRAGILNSKSDFITFAYADLQDPLTLIDEMYEKAANSEIVWAHRKSRQVSFSEKLFSSFYANLMKRFVSSDFPKSGFDIVLFSKKVRNELNDNIENNSSIFLQILTLGFNQGAIYYDKLERKKGKSKWTFSKKVKLFIDSFVAFSYMPIKLVTIVGTIFFVLGIFWSTYIIGRELIIGDLDRGWPALVSILMIGFGVTNIGLGILAEYLWRTLDASRKRPVFVIDEIIDFKLK